ncbi:hypothetical protein [Streptomyces chartreusis]|uniref:hypothetical protein n=1 Tax=Streptomyces chartreusis TaxID=1969 RepID=UPI0033A5115C
MAEELTERASEQEFPEVEVRVSSVNDRARATFAKTHHRPSVPDFSQMFAGSEK